MTDGLQYPSLTNREAIVGKNDGKFNEHKHQICSFHQRLHQRLNGSQYIASEYSQQAYFVLQ